MFRLQCRWAKHLRMFEQTYAKNDHLLPIQNHRSTRSFSNCENTDGIRRTFDELLHKRRLEAGRSILVQVNSDKSYHDLYHHCAPFGTIKNAFHYRVNQKCQHILIEFDCDESAQNVLESSVFEASHITASSRFLWFRANKQQSQAHSNTNTADIRPLEIVNGTDKPTENQFIEQLRQQSTIDDQIMTLYRNTNINELGCRLRFMAAAQIEDCVRGIFPMTRAYPFGSSVNGFGKMSSDVDLVLCTQSEYSVQNANQRLVFHSRSNNQSERYTSQNHLRTIADIADRLLPGIMPVQAILQARVPIFRYTHEYLNLQVDVSMHNMSAVYMSELLFLFGELDSRIRPLMFCIRHWAKTTGILRSTPGTWISNFGLTCLALFYFQQINEPLLPSLNHLILNARPEDSRMVDSSEISYLRDFNCLDFKSSNTKTLEELLLGFFIYYSNFDFRSKALSLHTATAINKTDNAAIFVVNPIEPHLNVTKNIVTRECERLQNGMKFAWQAFETEIETKKATRNENWGILPLFHCENSIGMQMNLLTTTARPTTDNTPVADYSPRYTANLDLERLMNVKNLYSKRKRKIILKSPDVPATSSIDTKQITKSNIVVEAEKSNVRDPSAIKYAVVQLMEKLQKDKSNEQESVSVNIDRNQRNDSVSKHGGKDKRKKPQKKV